MRTLNELPNGKEDARSVLLALDDETRKTPKYMFNAYKDTQPD